MVSVVLLVVACVFAVAAQAQNFNSCPGALNTQGWCDCAPANSGILLTNFAYAPNPPVVGQPLSGIISGNDTYSSPVTGGSVSLLIQYFGVTLLNQTASLCTLLSESPFPGTPKCPLPPATLQTTNFKFDIPTAIPPGTYTGQIVATDQSNRIIQCVQLNLTFQAGSARGAPKVA